MSARKHGFPIERQQIGMESAWCAKWYTDVKRTWRVRCRPFMICLGGEKVQSNADSGMP